MISIETTGTETVLAAFETLPARVRKAAVRALNRGINSARTVEVRAIAKDTGLKSADVNKALRLRLASDGQPEASLQASLTRLPLIQFRAKGPVPTRGKGRGVTARLPSSRRYPKAFIATMASGHTGVFRRGNKRAATSPRLPIRELYGPSIGHVFARYRSEGLARGVEVFKQEFTRQLALKGTPGA